VNVFGRLGRAVAPLGCIALVGGLLIVPPAAAAETPLAAAKTKTIVGDFVEAPALSVAPQWVSPGRPGGQGEFEVVFASTSRAGEDVRELETRVVVAEGTSIESLSGGDWQCSIASDGLVATCALPGTVGSKEDPPAISGMLAIDSGFTDASASIVASARWSGAERTVGDWVVSDRGAVPVYPKVTLRLTSSSEVITAFANGPRESRRFPLLAEVGRLQGQYATLTWRQVSGPPVTFLKPREVEGVAANVDQTVEVTRVPKRAKYVFEARVVAQGQIVERQVEVVVQGSTLLDKLSAASPAEAAIAKATTLPALDGALRVESERDLRIDGPVAAPAASTVTLRATGGDARRAQVTWSIDGRRVGSGSEFRVSAPRDEGAALLVEARVALPSGGVSEAGHVLIATGRGKTTRTLASPRDRDGFCGIASTIRQRQDKYDSRSLDLPMGPRGQQRLIIGSQNAEISGEVFDEKGACSGSGTISIVDAVLVQSSTARLARVVAELSSNGLTVTRARLTVNSTLSNKWTDKLGLDITGDMAAGWDAGALGTFSGSASFDPISINGEPPVNPVALVADVPEGWDLEPDASRVAFAKDLSVSLSGLVRAPANSQGARGTIAVRIDLADKTPVSATATLANVTLGETPRGGLIVASGSGTYEMEKEVFSVSIPVECVGGWESRQCELFDGMRFGQVSLDVSERALQLSATAAIQYGASSAYGLTLAGVYRAQDDWEMSVTNPAPWDLGEGMVFRDLRGKIGSKPAADGAALRVSITGTFSGLTLGGAVDIKQVTPTLTNECPEDSTEEECVPDELRFYLTADVEATLPGNALPTRFRARADVNLATLDFVFESGATSLEVGPEELRLTDVRVVISKGAPTSCVPKGTVPDATDGVAVRFEGRARILSKNYELNVQSDQRGLCIWGSGDTIDIGGGLKAVTPKLAFTTFPGGATVDGTRELAPDRIIMNGGFVFPESLKERFGIPGRGVTFEADISTDLLEAHITVAYNADNDIVLYRGEGAVLSAGQFGFGMDLRVAGANPGFDGYFFGTGRLDIAGSGATPASSTPLELRVGVGFTPGQSFNIQLQAGVPSGRVANAFGVDGLVIRKLSASGAIDLVSGWPSIALNADVTLPDGWGASVGLLPDATIGLAVNLDAFRPCLEFRVGSRDGADVVDFGGLGLITGNHFRLVLAPIGCELPDGRRTTRIAAGWAFAVQGALMGSPFEATASLFIDSRGVRLDAIVEMPRLDLYGVVGFRNHEGVGGPKVTLDIDTARGIFDVTLDAAIEIGDVKSGFGFLASVKGDLKRQKDRFALNLTGTSRTSLGPIEVVLDPIKVVANFPEAGKESATNQLFVDISTSMRATLNLEAFGRYTIAGSGRIQMQDFVVTQLSLRADAVLDAIVYRVDGSVAFDLCTGTLSEIAADGTGSQCTLFSQGKLASATPAVRVGVTGTEYVVLKEPKPFAKIIYDRSAREG
jgi:hypothetical protein